MSEHAEKITGEIEELLTKLRGALDGWTKSNTFLDSLTEENLRRLHMIGLYTRREVLQERFDQTYNQAEDEQIEAQLQASGIMLGAPVDLKGMVVRSDIAHSVLVKLAKEGWDATHPAPEIRKAWFSDEEYRAAGLTPPVPNPKPEGYDQ